ncbi:MAG: SLC13 family permease [bacterium]|nr:SLC13 family permease [bacterium]
MTPEIALVLGVLGVAIVLFVTELVRVDVVAMLVMVTLPWLGLIEPEDAFLGLSRGAVVSIMAVVIMGHGLDRTGMTRLLARPLLRVGGKSARRLLGVLLASVGCTSAFMQNVGAAALFLPIGTRIGRVASLRTSQLLMPLGFAAILGGTLSMIGSSPLIVLNDLVAGQGEERFDLFAVTPIGLTLLGSCVLLFVLFGKSLLPKRASADLGVCEAESSAVLASWSVLENVEEAMIPTDSPLVGTTRKDAQLIERFDVHVLAMREVGRTIYAPSAKAEFRAGQRLALLGAPEEIARLCEECGLRSRHTRRFPELIGSETAGFAELLVSPRSTFVGMTLREVGMRRHYGIEPLSLLTGGERRSRDFADQPIKPGDLVLVHGSWKRIRTLGADKNFVLLTHLGADEVDYGKGWLAVLCFTTAIVLALLGFPLPHVLFSGALAMILTRVMTVDDAYRAVSWRTVFLLAGLLPLGVAMDQTGAAAYLASQMFRALDGAPTLAILFTVAALTTGFTLFMSNIAATVVLVPLVMDLGRLTGIDPRALALLVGICAQNSFLLPTHQVNALLMVPGGYKNADYLKAGGIMTLLFLPIATFGVWLLWL